MSKQLHYIHTYIHIHIYSTKISHINKPLNFIYTVVPPYPLIQYLRFTAAQKNSKYGKEPSGSIKCGEFLG
jgi:hypothetical protein